MNDLRTCPVCSAPLCDASGKLRCPDLACISYETEGFWEHFGASVGADFAYFDKDVNSLLAAIAATYAPL